MTDEPLGLDSVVNFREVGGLRTRDGGRVRQGCVFRSGHLNAASDDDLAHMTRLGIRTVIDFRTTDDWDGPASGRLPEGARRVHLPMGDPSSITQDLWRIFNEQDARAAEQALGNGKAEAMMARAAEALVVQRTTEYAEMVRTLIEDDALAVLVHCAAGKDRTGWAASLLLLALDVHLDDIIEHYVLSNRYRASENRRTLERLPAHFDPDWLRPFFEVRPEYVHASLGALEREFGDIHGYLTRGLALEAQELERLRELLID